MADAVPGLSVFTQPVQDIQIGTRISRTQYQYTLVDTDGAELALWAPRLLARLKDSPDLRNVATDQQDEGLVTKVTVDREAAQRLGVSMQTIQDVLYDSFGQRQISTIFSQANQYRVILEADPAWQADPNSLLRLRVPGVLSAQGQSTTSGATVSGASQNLIPLSAVATISQTVGPLAITHEQQFPSVTLSFDLATGASLGDAVQAVQAAEQQLGLPETVSGSYAGDAAEFQRSLASEPWLILAAVVVIYIVLGVLYESTIHPVTILSTLPSAGIGALLALMVFGLDLSLVALVGIVLLMGIVKKNAIMMIDFAVEAERERGLSPEAAIEEACLLRFRPIMMTTAAALLGALPLVLEHGTGSELRFPLGVTIVGGLAAQPIADAVYHAGDLRDVRAPAPALRRRAAAVGGGVVRVARSLTQPSPSGRGLLAGRFRAVGSHPDPLPRSGRGSKSVNFSTGFILRPIGTALLALGLLLSGIVAYNFLPVAPLPSVDIPFIVVFASRPGADPETMATSIASPLERHLGEIAGVTELTSTSAIGSTTIVCQFDVDRDIEGAAHDVQAAINAATADLPSDLPVRPFYRKFNPAEAPILTIALTSDTLSPGQVYDAADTILAQRLAQLDGVSQVQINGAEKPAVRVRLNPGALRAAGLAGQDVFTAIRNANVTEATGSFEGRDRAQDIAVNGQMTQAERLCRAGDQVAERLRPAPVGRGERDRRRGQHPPGRVGRTAAGDPAVYQQGRGRERDRHGRPHQGGAAALARLDAAGHQGTHPARPHDHHPRQRGRRADHAADLRRPGAGGGDGVHAPPGADAGRGGDGAALHRRHAGRHVAARLLRSTISR